MAIKEAKNKVTIDGSDKKWGGCVVSLSYNISFGEAPSSISITIANKSGVYEDPSLGGENIIKFGSQPPIRMVVTSYRLSKGSSGRTLNVTFDDMSLQELDKTVVLLRYKHLVDPDLAPRVMTLGYMFAQTPDSDTGSLERYYGLYQGGVEVKYNLTDLANGIARLDIPISERFDAWLRSFGDSLEGTSGQIPSVQRTFFRDDTGTLRGVLASIASAMGIATFWNNDVGGNFRYGSDKGMLDFIELKDNLDAQIVENTVGYINSFCNITDKSTDRSIKNCHVTGAIGSFQTTETIKRNAVEPFARFKFLAVGRDSKGVGAAQGTEEVQSPYDVGRYIELPMRPTDFLGDQVDPKKQGNPQLFDLEMLIRAAMAGPEFFRNFVLTKKIAEMMSKIAGGNDIRNRIIEETDQDNDGDPVGPNEAGFLGNWFFTNGGGNRAHYLNVARNKAVETLFPHNSSFPLNGGDPDYFTFLPVAKNPPIIGNNFKSQRTWIRKNHSAAGLELFEHIVEQDARAWPRETVNMALPGGGETQIGYDWVGCIYATGGGIDVLINQTENESVYKLMLFLADNFGRYYYSVGRPGVSINMNVPHEEPWTGFGEDPKPWDVDEGWEGLTEMPALLTQRRVSERNYAGATTQWVFSDTVVTDTPLEYLWEFNMERRGDGQDWTASDYTIMKPGQSYPSIVWLPKDVISPSLRRFRVGGYAYMQSIYDYLRFFDRTTGVKVWRGSAGTGTDSEAGSQVYSAVSSFEEFVIEVFGVFSATEISRYSMTPQEGFTPRGSVEGAVSPHEGFGAGGKFLTPDDEGSPPRPMSMSQEAYGIINGWRAACKDGFKYATDMDYGILLYDRYGGALNEAGTMMLPGTEDFHSGATSGFPEFAHFDSAQVENLFKVDGGPGFEDDEDGGIAAFVINVPNNYQPVRKNGEGSKLGEAVRQSKVWGDILLDYFDMYLVEAALPFSFATTHNRVLLHYSYSLDPRLLTFRSSYIPIQGGGKDFTYATSINVKNVELNVGELKPTTNNFTTEFPRCDESDEVLDLEVALKKLNAILQSYVEVKLEPAVSYDFTVSGYGFGDEDYLPNIYDGLESVNISLGANGATTQIKIGNKRRTKATDELRKAIVLSELAGSPLTTIRRGSVNTSLSNQFLTRL